MWVSKHLEETTISRTFWDCIELDKGRVHLSSSQSAAYRRVPLYGKRAREYVKICTNRSSAWHEFGRFNLGEVL